MKRTRKKAENIAIEILWIFSAVFLFMTAACIDKRAVYREHLVAYVITLLADAVIFGGWIFFGGKGICSLKRRKKGIKTLSYEVRGIGLTLLFCLLTRIVQFKDIPRWDSLTYYKMLMNACQSFDFTLKTFWQNFSMAHPTLGFAGITAIGEFLNTGGYVGVLLVWLAVTLLTGFCMYRILEKILPSNTWVFHTLGTCAIMSTPNVLGTFSYYQPDMGLVCFGVFVIYCYLYKKNLLMFFAMILLLLTKEPGVVILGGFGVGALVGRVVFTGKEKTAGKRLLQFFKEPLGISGILAVLMLVVYFVVFLKNGGSIWQYGPSGFGFQLEFIVLKCKQYFILNFNWLTWGGCLFLYVCRSLQHKRSKRNRGSGGTIAHKDIVLAIFFMALFQMLFFSLYITFANPRYQMMIDFCGAGLFVILLGGHWSERYAKNVKKRRRVTLHQNLTAGIVGVLLLVEAYLTFDPVSLLMFEKVDTGNGYIIREKYHEGLIQGDSTVYNHQFNYLTDVYVHILRDVDYHEGMDVIIWNNPGSYDILGDKYYWDTERKRILLIPGENAVMIRGYVQEELGKKEYLMQREAVFILVPQFNISEESAERFLKQHYEIRYKGSVDVTPGGTAVYYVCDLLGSGGIVE